MSIPRMSFKEVNEKCANAGSRGTNEMKTKNGSRHSTAQHMASRRRRRKRTYRLSIPLSLRLRRTRSDRTDRKSRSQKRAQRAGASMSRVLASALAVTMVGLLAWFFVDMRLSLIHI